MYVSLKRLVAGLSVGNWGFVLVLSLGFVVLRLNNGARTFCLFQRGLRVSTEIVC